MVVMTVLKAYHFLPANVLLSKPFRPWSNSSQFSKVEKVITTIICVSGIGRQPDGNVRKHAGWEQNSMTEI
jgi:hypothetical protein